MIESICWTCKNAVNSRCSWSANYYPVPGWTAVRKDLTSQHGGVRMKIESYRVIDCPLYVSDPPRPPKTKYRGPYYDAPICKACYSRDVCMSRKGTCNERSRQ